MMVKGISHEELAVHLGAQPGTVMDPDTAHEMLKLSPGPWDLPDYAMLGETGNGWAFAVESPEARDRVDRTMDPPIISVNVVGKHTMSPTM